MMNIPFLPSTPNKMSLHSSSRQPVKTHKPFVGQLKHFQKNSLNNIRGKLEIDYDKKIIKLYHLTNNRKYNLHIVQNSKDIPNHLKRYTGQLDIEKELGPNTFEISTLTVYIKPSSSF